MSPVSRRDEPAHANGTEILVVEYKGKTMRASVTSNAEGQGVDDAPVEGGGDIHINLITSRSKVEKEVREMLEEAKTGSGLLLMYPPSAPKIKRDILKALGLPTDSLTA